MANSYSDRFWAEEDWLEELEYIYSVRPQAPGACFNDDPQCFADYVSMQAYAATRAGFPYISECMLQHVEAG